MLEYTRKHVHLANERRGVHLFAVVNMGHVPRIGLRLVASVKIGPTVPKRKSLFPM